MWIAVAIGAWFALSLPLGLVVGRAVRHADLVEGAADASPANSPRPALAPVPARVPTYRGRPVPTPTSEQLRALLAARPFDANGDDSAVLHTAS